MMASRLHPRPGRLGWHVGRDKWTTAGSGVLVSKDIAADMRRRKGA